MVVWDGPYNSGDEVTFNHTWSEKGTYIIKAKAKDIYDYESQWGTLTVIIPKSKTIVNNLYRNLLDVFRILQYFINKI
jgi:hypothetical protein